jgi:hypothetical protein
MPTQLPNAAPQIKESLDALEQIIMGIEEQAKAMKVVQHTKVPHAPGTISGAHPVPQLAMKLYESSPPSQAGAAGKRFALLVAGIVLIFLLAENFNKIRMIPSRLKQDKKTVLAWALYAGLMYSGAILQPRAEDPSILITFGAGTLLFSFVLLWVIPSKDPRPPAPAEFPLIMITALAFRLSSTTRFLGYLPTDATGDGCYQALEAVALLVACRGLAAVGVSLRQARNVLLTVATCSTLGYFCHGDLDQRPLWDRAYASSIFMEFMAWGFLAPLMLRRRDDKPTSFLLPAAGQAAIRAVFWFLAADEMASARPQHLMAYFPQAVVWMSMITALGLLLLTLTTFCEPGEILPTEMRTMPNGESKPEPFALLMQQAMSFAGDHGISTGLMPVRAVYEDGKLRVEYEKTA